MFSWWAPKDAIHVLCNRVRDGRSRSSKVVDVVPIESVYSTSYWWMVINSNFGSLAPFLRYGDLLAENANFPYSSEWILSNFWIILTRPEMRVLGLYGDEDFVILACVILTQYQRVTDGTDRQIFRLVYGYYRALRYAQQRASLLEPEVRPHHLWPPNILDLNPVDYQVWGLMQERVYKTPVHDTTDLKQPHWSMVGHYPGSLRQSHWPDGSTTSMCEGKWTSFRAPAVANWLFSEPPSISNRFFQNHPKLTEENARLNFA